MSHYYSDRQLSGEINIIKQVIGGKRYDFYVSDGVFSKRKIDFGSQFLIEYLMQLKMAHLKLLDIGCGYGPIGICLASTEETLDVTMIDINRAAVSLAEKNIALHHLRRRVSVYHHNVAQCRADQPFDIVVTNPPIRAGKAVVFDCYRAAYQSLISGGRLYVVIQKKQGMASSRKFMTDLFGSCQIMAKRAGYYILQAARQ